MTDDPQTPPPSGDSTESDAARPPSWSLEQDEPPDAPAGGESSPPTLPATNGLAIAAMVLGIVAFVTFGITALVGAPLGHVALRRSRAINGKGSAQAITGIVCSYAAVVLLAALIAIGVLRGDSTSDNTEMRGDSTSDNTEMSIDTRVDADAGRTDASDSRSGEPMLDIDSSTTWRQLIEAIADENEMGCIRDVLDDELLEDLLDITVTEPVGWPVVGSEFFGIGVGSDRWPHELWRCMSPRSATAVYLSVFAQEEGLSEYGLDADATNCISGLTRHRGLSQTAAQLLGSEATFEGGDFAGFMDALDEQAAELVIPCVPALAEAVIGAAIQGFFKDALSDDELDCVVAAALEEARRNDVDLDAVIAEMAADGEAVEDGLPHPFVAVIFSVLDVCVPDDDAAAEPVSRLVFVSGRDGDMELYVANADGSEARQLTHDDAWSSSASWSPDGTRLVFSADPDGNSEIYAINADGSGRVQLTNDAAKDVHPSWSPEGDLIVFQSTRTSSGRMELYVMESDGGNVRKITDGLHDVDGYYPQAPSWSPDGARIAFNNRSGIFTIAVDGTDRVLVTQSGVAPAWSPDGRRIAFAMASEDTEVLGIYVVNADGTGLARLSSGDHHFPSWSPAGDRIVFVDNRTSEILTTNADGTEVGSLAHPQSGLWPQWSRIPFADGS